MTAKGRLLPYTAKHKRVRAAMPGGRESTKGGANNLSQGTDTASNLRSLVKMLSLIQIPSHLSPAQEIELQ